MIATQRRGLPLPAAWKTTVVIAAMFGTLLSACGTDVVSTQVPTPFATTDPTELQLRSYDAFWEGIQSDYIFSAVTTFDWNLLPAQERRKVASGLSEDEFDLLMRSIIVEFPENTVTYRNRTDRIEDDLNSTLSYEGIGAYVSVSSEPSPHVIILAVVPDSPAEQSGLRAHDSIYAVDGQSVSAEEGMDVVKRVRGPAGSVVKLDVQSPDGSRRSINVTRRRLQATDQLRVERKDIAHAGLIRLPIGAGAELSNIMQQALEELAEYQPRNLIIDMRVAHSSATWPLNEMLGFFTEGEMGNQYSHSGQQTLEITGVDLTGSQSIPLILLIGQETRGASEVFAAALQATGRATLIGQPTPGQVIGFDHFILPNGGEIFFGSSSYVSPSGDDIGMRGVHPDITVDTHWDEVTDDEDAVVKRALLQLTQ